MNGLVVVLAALAAAMVWRAERVEPLRPESELGRHHRLWREYVWALLEAVK